MHAEALLQVPPGCTRGWPCPCRFGGTGAVLHRCRTGLHGCRTGLHGCCTGLRPPQLPEPGSGCSQDRCGCSWGYGRLLNFCQWLFSPANCYRQCTSAPTPKSNSRAVKPICGTEVRLAVSGAGLALPAPAEVHAGQSRGWGDSCDPWIIKSVVGHGPAPYGHRVGNPPRLSEQQLTDSLCSQTCLALAVMPSRCFSTITLPNCYNLSD